MSAKLSKADIIAIVVARIKNGLDGLSDSVVRDVVTFLVDTGVITEATLFTDTGK